ncbi:lysoplasmalogenase family protein [Novosphingobium sp.]|uniref:lysoplasmalogenase family protein n=1 Tax=Novosphingobium sp. TaxID=1874826 RepID=UPI00286A6AA3|nr:lysoplasmalogenase family protein [Novosphingobium sp.]
MPRRALIEKRPWLLASLVAGIGYFFIAGSALPDLYEWAIKGAGAAFLAAYALSRHAGRDATQIAAVMAFGALGDVLIELDIVWGALAFLAGHLIAVQLYWRHRRASLSGSQQALALALVLLVPLIAFQLPADRAGAPGVAFYALGLAAMAASAWTSTFPRYRVGLGAVMFVISDLLIFARLGALAESVVPGLLIWPLYYFGQFLICTGVVGELRTRSTPQ